MLGPSELRQGQRTNYRFEMAETNPIKFSIGARMLASFLVITILTSAIVVVAIVRLGELDAELRELAEEEIPELNAVWRIGALISALDANLSHVVLGHEVADNLDRVRKTQAEIPEALQAFRNLQHGLWIENERLYNQLVVQYRSYDDVIQRVVVLAEQGQRERLEQLIVDELEDRHEAMSNTLGSLLTFENREVGGMAALAVVKGERSRILIIFLAVVGVVLSVILALVMTRSLTRPITKLVGSMERVADGDLSLHADIVREDEIGQLARRFNEMLGRLNQLLSDQKQFYSNASHELRTPLTVIRGEAEVALRTPQSAESYRDTLQNVAAGAAQMGRLVDELLFLVRTEAGQLEYEMGEVALEPLLREVIDSVEALASLEDLKLKIEDISAVVIPGDRDRLRQLFVNLIDNAIKYTLPGGQITLAGVTGPEDVIITVADTGIGIAAGELPYVFERFYRGDTAKSTRAPGVGLGLPIVASIAGVHGGKVHIDSTVGRGTIVWVTLPRTTESE